jgi:hypothetical protein
MELILASIRFYQPNIIGRFSRITSGAPSQVR